MLELKHSKFFLQTVSILLIVFTLASALPNIRILVNNENFQSPPYLLEAIKRADSETIQQQAPSIQPQTSQDSRVASIGPSETKTEFEQPTSAALIGSKSSLAKDESVEETLDFDQETSPLKLAPSELIDAADQFSKNGAQLASASEESYANEPAQSGESSAATVAGNSYTESQLSNEAKPLQVEQNQAPHIQARKPQLPVTNAHLKKPATVLMDEEDSTPSNPQISNSTLVGDKNGGAKSLVSVSVSSDEDQKQEAELDGKKTNKKKSVFQKQPADTWEPSQVMQGVTNTSLVPATITREYGQHTRTRITLGGGYVRDKSPALVNPASSEYSDDRPEKPVAPLERTKLNPQAGPDSAPAGTEVSKVVEVPERIIVPISATRKASNKIQLTASVNKRQFVTDPRCPKEGVSTFEHATACDKYYYCENGQSTELTCPNGLMYGTHNVVRDYCIHRWQATCDDKSIPNPISSPGCRWQYGIFNVQGSPKCSPDYYECYDGKFEVKKCSAEGQVYDDRTKSCKFAELVGCTQEALADFHCPPDDQSNTYWPFPRYFLNERALIHCVNDKPQIVRCTSDERVDPEHLHCVSLKKLLADGNLAPTPGSLESRKLVREKKRE